LQGVILGWHLVFFINLQNVHAFFVIIWYTDINPSRGGGNCREKAKRTFRVYLEMGMCMAFFRCFVLPADVDDTEWAGEAK
jgi:hypothetical protein